MRFLIDQNLPDILTIWLQEHGQIAEHVRVLGLDQAADGIILRHAIDTGAVLVSKDANFAHARNGSVQLVWVRIGNTTNDRLIQVWRRAWPRLLTALEAGEPVVELQPS